jgi:BMFP domain-containing protein YqiC
MGSQQKRALRPRLSSPGSAVIADCKGRVRAGKLNRRPGTFRLAPPSRRTAPAPIAHPELAMLESQKLEELAARLAAVLPPGVMGLRKELEENFRAVLRANLERFDLVSRERFDIQAQLLSRSIARIEALEQRLKTLESEKA